jgi:hypothetical protein
MEEDDKLDLVWGAKGIGEEINRTAPQTHYMLERGLIPCAIKVGKQWAAPRSALRRRFSAPTE